MTKKFKKIAQFLYHNVPLHLIFLLTGLLPNSVPTVRLRGFLLKPFFKSCGKNLKISSGVILNNTHQIEIGDNVVIAHNAWINGVGGLKIENNVLIGPMSVIVTSQHVYRDGKLSTKYKSAPVHIESDCWIASHVVITEGITVGRHSIIAAGAVVTKSLPEKSKVGGVPAKQIGAYNNE
ncbi:acyltransferase [Brochothrix thermosphacta]|uniref:acyltransferase n=1 Tax=Brochothrix thermosphacta TaxID=2756 RepID=UPI00083FB188|nr:acyltransferase [Brochothrix thermosphacta]ODJ62573.1 hypothetical protein BFR35_10895 [Brochothrix thermosphacta]ODJ66570.1 hypothetical protein BFR37_08575 [Brochothrix thermosphacta]SPN71248.1 putative acetyltransferase hexapeptide family protein [Brochothrix thermosphacta]